MQLLRESGDLAEAAKAKAAEALLKLECPYSKDQTAKEDHKAVKNNVRDCYIWRSTGWLLGMDLETATMNLVWEDTASRLSGRREDRDILSSQLTNSFKRTKENLLKYLLQTLPYPKPRHKDGDGYVFVHPAGPPNQAIHAGALGRLKVIHAENQESMKLLCELEDAFAAELKLLQNPPPPPPPPPTPPPPPLLAGATPRPPTRHGER